MRTVILILVLIHSSFLSLYGQTTKADKPLKALDFMIGEWHGDSWMMTREGKQESVMKEIVECKQDCNIMVVEGLGTKFDSETKEVKITHEAFAVITYDMDSQSYQIRAYKDGNVTKSDIEILSENRIRWKMEVPNRGKVRFTIDYTDTTWKETGEFSRDDGESWMQFLGMELTKVSK